MSIQDAIARQLAAKRKKQGDLSVSQSSVSRRADGKVINEQAQCTAIKRNGERCQAYAIKGSNVCRVHGGAAPQVQRAAKVRLAMASDWLVAELLDIARRTDDDKTKLTAIFGALDRAGLGTKQSVEVEVGVTPGYIQTLMKIRRDLPTDQTALPAHIDRDVDPSQIIVDAEVVEDVAEHVDDELPANAPPEPRTMNPPSSQGHSLEDGIGVPSRARSTYIEH